MRQNFMILIISASVTFQFVAAFLALRLIRISGRMAAWMLVAAALFVMGLRRLLALVHVVDGSQRGDVTVEILGLAISILMVLGIALIRPLFEELSRSRRELLEKKMEVETVNHTLEERVAAEVNSNLEKDRIMLIKSREAAMGEMVSGIAHQWKQPLNNLSLVIQEVQYEYRDGTLQEADFYKSVDTCLDLIQHMSTTIDEFRTFFVPQDGSKQFSLAHEASIAVKLASAGLEKYGVKIINNVEEDSLLTGSPNECSQVILSLLQNAQEVFQDRKIAEPVLSIRIYREDNKAILTVTDNAGGIPAELLGTLFDAYITSKENGSGIGLYLSRLIVEKKLGGSISARNIEGGAEFKVEI
jgi:C4-dicarboxylate-specific signal transduction histidine kinase